MNMKFLHLATLALACVASSAVSAAEPGVTDKEIKIGQTGPYSGPASIAVALMQTPIAYFKMINETGGIHGRKINLISLDDAYSPPKTVEMTRRLMEQDNVFFMFGQVGSPAAAAAQPYLNAKKVPQLFSLVGTSRFNDPAKFPWTIGTIVSYKAEGILFGKYIKQKMPNAKVGILYQNDDLGRDYVEGVTEGLGDLAKSTIVAKVSLEPTEPTFDSQVLALKASGANALVIATGPKPAVYAIRKAGELGWKPQTFLTAGANSVSMVMEPAGVANGKGVITTATFKDPSDPRWQSDPDYIEYSAFMAKYLPQLNKNDSYAVMGYVGAQLMTKVLNDVGPNPTREGIRKAATSIRDYRPKMAMPDIKLMLTPNDYDMYKKLNFMRFNGTGWEPFDAGVL